jgi:predicted phage terminase large subunit-like protein
VEFPELKVLATEEYNTWDPDSFIVEKKSSGTPLYQEMRRAGLMVQEYTPVRGTTNNPNSKMARLNSISDIISSGLVWVPATRWAEELIEEVAGFPFAPNDDAVDTTIMALMRFRQGGFIRLPTDEPDPEPVYRRRAAYY